MRDVSGYQLYVTFVDLLAREAREDPGWFDRMQDGAWSLGVHRQTPDWA